MLRPLASISISYCVFQAKCKLTMNNWTSGSLAVKSKRWPSVGARKRVLVLDSHRWGVDVLHCVSVPAGLRLSEKWGLQQHQQGNYQQNRNQPSYQKWETFSSWDLCWTHVHSANMEREGQMSWTAAGCVAVLYLLWFPDEGNTETLIFFYCKNMVVCEWGG